MPPGYRHMPPVPYATWYRHMPPVSYATWVPSYDTRVICHLGVAYDGPPYPVMLFYFLNYFHFRSVHSPTLGGGPHPLRPDEDWAP